ncbi:MAG: hypothetical protein UT48_C0002G0014 [Parcubacteria group bacterium GW2011_GWE2_39_37]|uniref:Uncharacterized protein n=1 Tax=Candidatus Falkowbacteria bacterium GW2011_GWF2_39_8 TaxID=1618642 RepID=A0A0G0PVS1_9BACT|nr:MAG: hypothetical protein UT48_C0002G0014 [Parcubacteria group bacterium GW2011_GWE2_39_37]KKR32028.1 MAG: hypothetical protein UT64_C0044G0005 [Candidatus Falkowbacteria bacterium GW2011_GWF2_39_8]
MKEIQLDLFKNPESMEAVLESAVEKCLEKEEFKNAEKLFVSFLIEVKEQLDPLIAPEKRLPFASPMFIEMVTKILEKNGRSYNDLMLLRADDRVERKKSKRSNIRYVDFSAPRGSDDDEENKFLKYG